jgi:CHAT domain-containing protein
MRTADRRGGGFAGLGEAFLAAGAGGVVGTLWPVDDEWMANLMRQFHNFYSMSGDATASLQQAQLSLLQSPRPELRSPASWAGVRYFGH